MDKTQQELCKEEIEAIMAKYPTYTLNVHHSIQVVEMPPTPVVKTEVLEDNKSVV